jgi:RHS repeat-associated protein
MSVKAGQCHNPTRTDASGSYAFTLDDYGREAGLTNPLPLNNPYAWTYTASGLVASVTDPTANVTTNTYDPLNRLTARSTTGSTGCTNCVSLTDTYNDASDIVLSTSTIAPSPTSTTTYAYDPLARLTTYTPPSAIQPQVYTWNGQPDRASITIGNGTKLTTTFDAASRPTIDSLSRTYTSDNEGRITSFPITGSPGQALTYDALGRLTQVKDSSGTVLATYTYDALDRLRTATENSATTRFLYVGLSNAVAQENNTSTGITNHATDMAGTDLFDFNATGNVSGYLGRNSHDDVVWTASTTGAVAATLTYDPYGNLVSSTGSTLPNTRWQSSHYDGAAGLYYVIARWFAPSLGTFLSDDPLTASQADSQARDPYAYGAGDAIDRIDPTGRSFGVGTIYWQLVYNRVTDVWDQQATDVGHICDVAGLAMATVPLDLVAGALWTGGSFAVCNFVSSALDPGFDPGTVAVRPISEQFVYVKRRQGPWPHIGLAVRYIKKDGWQYTPVASNGERDTPGDILNKYPEFQIEYHFDTQEISDEWGLTHNGTKIWQRCQRDILNYMETSLAQCDYSKSYQITWWAEGGTSSTHSVIDQGRMWPGYRWDPIEPQWPKQTTAVAVTNWSRSGAYAV